MMNTSNPILITGASRGIGKATALALLDQQIPVIALARSESKLAELKKSHPDLVTVITADLTNPECFDELETLLKSQKVKLRGLIHNAGALINKPFTETTAADWDFMIRTNVMSAVHVIRCCKPFFTENAHIVNIGSMGGFQGSSKFPGLTAYSVTKGSLSILTECLATEFMKDKICVNCLCLGAVQTEMLEAAFPGLQAPVEPDEMGEFIASFVLQAQKYFNGKVLPVSLADPG